MFTESFCFIDRKKQGCGTSDSPVISVSDSGFVATHCTAACINRTKCPGLLIFQGNFKIAWMCCMTATQEKNSYIKFLPVNQAPKLSFLPDQGTQLCLASARTHLSKKLDSFLPDPC